MFHETPNSFEDFKGPRKLSISTSPEFGSSKDFDSSQVTPMKKVKTKHKKKRKSKSKMVVDYEFIGIYFQFYYIKRDPEFRLHQSLFFQKFRGDVKIYEIGRVSKKRGSIIILVSQ